MVGHPRLEARQIWAVPTPINDLPRSCRPKKLAPGGVVSIDGGALITLANTAVYQPACTNLPQRLNVSAPDFNISVLDSHRRPFYASTSPQAYALSACTVVSYMLVIILFITPRTFFVGGAGGGSSFLGRRGMINGASGSTSIIGVGGRPWLQKVAALTVAISLTIATVDTFDVAEKQYDHGYQDALALTNEVLDGLELKIARLISSTFLWLALAQTLIRLFPRHREKVMIKWIGFFLIVLDTLFSAFNSFIAQKARTRPRRLTGAIPALSYLFTFVLEIVYMLMVLQYTLSKRRFAFYHPKMRNMSLMALLSVTAVLIPVVFFTLDMLKPEFTGWGSYVRWVGAAAASVLVWEWVERIEALERDENKDGILGREIYDGDEMLGDARSSVVSWPSSRYDSRGSGTLVGNTVTLRSNPASGRDGGSTLSKRLAGIRGIPLATYRKRHRRVASMDDVEKTGASEKFDTTLTSTTVFSPHTLASQNIISNVMEEVTPSVDRSQTPSGVNAGLRWQDESMPSTQTEKANETPVANQSILSPFVNLPSLPRWSQLQTMFSRNKKVPPAEVSKVVSQHSSSLCEPTLISQSTEVKSSDLLARLRSSRRAKRSRSKGMPREEIVIPWQPRGQELLRRLEEEENDGGDPSGDQVQPRQRDQHIEVWRREQQCQPPEVISRSQTISPRSQGTQSAIGPEHSISLQGTPIPRNDE